MDGLHTIDKYYSHRINKINNKIDDLIDDNVKKEKYKELNNNFFKELDNSKNIYSFSNMVYLFVVSNIVSDKQLYLDLFGDQMILYLKKMIIEDLLDKNSKNIFMAFDFINEVMEELNFNVKEKLDVYNFIITKNIKNKISINNVLKLDKEKIKDNNLEEPAKFFFYLPNKDKYLKKSIWNKNVNHLIKLMNKCSIKAENEVIAHNVFSLAFNKEKKEDYDIKNIIDSLKVFNFSDSDIQKVQKHYEKVKKKNIIKEDTKINIEFNSYEKKEEEKQYLRNELSKYLDKRDNLIHFLEYKDLKKLVNILIKLDYDKDSIRKIICENDVKLKSHNLTDKYNYYIELMKTYAEKCGFLKEYEELNNSYKKGVILKDNMTLMLKYMPNMSEYLLK